MKPKIKPILTGILIGIIAFPTITLGGTFVSSLIQGKTVEEAAQILAEQIDSLIGRVEVLETKQSVLESQQLKQDLWQKKEEACRSAYEINHFIPLVVDRVGKSVAMNSSCQESIQGRWDHIYRRPAIASGVSLDTIEKIYNWEKSCPEHPDLSIIKPAYDEYLQVKQECEELTIRYEKLYGSNE